jgi:hypothetical protein
MLARRSKCQLGGTAALVCNTGGAEWDVELAPGTRADARHYQIAAVHGNRLVVVEKKPTRTGHPLSTTKE